MAWSFAEEFHSISGRKGWVCIAWCTIATQLSVKGSNCHVHNELGVIHIIGVCFSVMYIALIKLDS